MPPFRRQYTESAYAEFLWNEANAAANFYRVKNPLEEFTVSTVSYTESQLTASPNAPKATKAYVSNGVTQFKIAGRVAPVGTDWSATGGKLVTYETAQPPRVSYLQTRHVAPTISLTFFEHPGLDLIFGNQQLAATALEGVLQTKVLDAKNKPFGSLTRGICVRSSTNPSMPKDLLHISLQPYYSVNEHSPPSQFATPPKPSTRPPAKEKASKSQDAVNSSSATASVSTPPLTNDASVAMRLTDDVPSNGTNNANEATTSSVPSTSTTNTLVAPPMPPDGSPVIVPAVPIRAFPIGSLYPPETIPGYSPEKFDATGLRAIQQRVFDNKGFLVLPSRYEEIFPVGVVAEAVVTVGASKYKRQRDGVVLLYASVKTVEIQAIEIIPDPIVDAFEHYLEDYDHNSPSTGTLENEPSRSDGDEDGDDAPPKQKSKKAKAKAKEKSDDSKLSSALPFSTMDLDEDAEDAGPRKRSRTSDDEGKGSKKPRKTK